MLTAKREKLHSFGYAAFRIEINFFIGCGLREEYFIYHAVGTEDIMNVYKALGVELIGDNIAIKLSTDEPPVKLSCPRFDMRFGRAC